MTAFDANLKNCPFCGETASFGTILGRPGVMCMKCCAMMRGLYGDPPEIVVERWNTRYNKDKENI